MHTGRADRTVRESNAILLPGWQPSAGDHYWNSVTRIVSREHSFVLSYIVKRNYIKQHYDDVAKATTRRYECCSRTIACGRSR